MPFLFSERRIKQISVLISDSLLISASLSISYSLRFNTLELSDHVRQILTILPVLLSTRLGIFISFGLYRGMWRFVGTRDLISLVKAVTLSSVLTLSLFFLLFRLETYPRSIFVIEWFVSLVLLGGSRFGYRLYREGAFRQNKNRSSGPGKNVLIVGAGQAGEMILRELLGNNRLSYNPIGFVDDNRKKLRRTIHGITVLGHTRDIPRIVDKYNVAEIFFAIPSAPSKAKRRIMLLCKRTTASFKTLPGVGELLDGTVKVSALHEFQIEDLLGRESVRLDTAAIGAYLRDKTVLITGSGGSIGSELCRQVAQFSPKRLVLYDNSEFNLYQIEMNLIELFPELIIYPIIGSVLNQRKVEKTLKEFTPEVVFHAAAYKHVPLMELNIGEALCNNALGTWIVAKLAQKYGVMKFVMISTDKAVRPTNIMGVSKRMAELFCQSFGQNSKTQFVTVRFGNVLNSMGSVIPLFKRQIAKGGPITVTHPDIYRYFMTIPEAVQLIMQAGAMGRGGEIFILDMGEPIKIADLARDMITLSGLEPDKDIKIVFTGLRPGEKLYEELLSDGEEVKSTLHDKIKVVGADEIEWDSLLQKMEELLNSLENEISDDIIVSKIKDIVPEFHPENGGPCASSLVTEERSCEITNSRLK